ncbi:MAG: hypothetical protein Q8O67_11945 [Deltaproteobacteria bacterium]|nr:hypothetical protein [Deltaproteobacteria bacterium]
MTSTDTPIRSPASPSALPHLELQRGPEQRSLVELLVRPSAFEQKLRTQTCPQCGLNPAGPLVKRSFQWVPGWVYIGLLLNIAILLIMYMAGRRVVKAEISLCADCDAADRHGRSLRSVSVAGVVLGPALFAFAGGITVGTELAIAGACAGLVAGIVGIIAAHRRTRFDVIGVKHIDRKVDTMTLRVSPSFARVLAAEAPDALRP